MSKTTGPFQLPPLPYDEGALEPVISARTMKLHHGKHHNAYVTKLNELVAGTPFAEMPLERIMAETAGKEQHRKIFNNAAQTWNHTFFWNCLKPGGSTPQGEIAKRLDSDLGGFESFKKEFAKAAVDTFGSGWAWLVDRGGKLAIMSTSNADNPLTQGATPILTLDVWEHAYYVDYENRRPEFAEAVIGKLLNWEFAQKQLEAAKQKKAA